MIIPAVHLLLMKEEKILLARRYNTGYHDGDWSVVAGHLEPGESPREAMIREALEEAGISIQSENLECVHVMSRITNDERVDFFFRCRIWENDPTIMESDKCDALEWFSLDNLPENVIPYIRATLEHMKT